MSLFSSIFGDNGADHTLDEALANINNIDVPTVESQEVQLQKLVQAGVLTPEQAQAALVNSNAFDSTSANNTGMAAEQSALGSLQGVVDAGGNDAQEKADLANTLSTLHAQDKGANDAILQNAAQRGALTSGLTTAAQLASNANNAASANSNALNANANAQSRVMQALSSLGSLGGNVQGQQYTQAANQANATNAIDEFNANQKQNTNQFNTTNNNSAQQANLTNAQNISNTNVANANTNAVRNADLVQQNFANKLAKGQAASGLSTSLANNQQNQANQNEQFIGGLIGTAGQVGAAAAGAAHGGVVPGHANVPGDHPANDTVPARLSPGEVVVPRSAAQSADGVMSFLHRMKQNPKMIKPTIHPKDVSTVLQALGHIRSTDEGAAQ